jgi:phosphoglucosamine mutase
MSVGADVWRLGVATTPAVAYLVRDLGLEGGVVISASHNPAPYNGIKFFDGDGYKLADALEDEVAALVSGPWADLPAGADLGWGEERSVELERYVEFVAGLAGPLTGLRIVCDCAHGAAWRLAPAAFGRAGAEVSAVAAAPDGLNINDGCGSLHPEMLGRAVVAQGAAVGFAFDGDADRLIAVDERGQVVDGDHLLAILGCDMLARDRLPGATVVATVMSNLGLEVCLQAAGGRLRRTRVGDRYVLEEMRRHGYALGGEQSGHIIFLDHHTTGDGLTTAALLADLLRRSGRPLSELAASMQVFPQVLRNLRVARRESLEGNARVEAAIRAAQERLGARGRVLVRPSGTEPLVRVMVEGEDPELVERAADDIAGVVAAEFGVV